MQYRILYTVHDGENEYPSETIVRFDRKPIERECIEAVINLFCREEHRADAMHEWDNDGCFTESPGYRMIDDIGLADYPNEEILKHLKTALWFWDRKDPKGDIAFDQISEFVAKIDG